MTATVCAIVRDEGPFILEWVAWQRLLGFDRILVYDNDSVDSTAAILADLARAGIVTHLLWPDQPGRAAQFSAYADAIARMAEATDWIAFVDADEFIVLHRHPGIASFLAGFAPPVSAIAINEAAYASGGQTAPDGRLVTERFTRRGALELYCNRWVKSIVRPADVAEAGIHVCSLHAGVYADPSGAPARATEQDRFPVHQGIAQVNHYILKSRAEFARKAARPNLASDPPGSHPARLRYSEAFFAAHDHNDVEDLCAARRSPELRAGMAALAHATGL